MTNGREDSDIVIKILFYNLWKFFALANHAFKMVFLGRKSVLIM